MRRYLLVCLLIAGLAGQAAHAQPVPTLQSGAYYRHANTSDVTIEVKVWGAVQNPGLYEVRQGLTLSSVLSLAGGPQALGQVPGTSSSFTVRLFRRQGEGPYRLFTETSMDKELLPLTQDPVLMSGDMLMTEERTRQRFGWRDGISILTALGTIALLFDNAFFQ